VVHYVNHYCPERPGGFKALGWWDYRSEEINAIVHGKPPPPSLPQRRYLTVKGPSFEHAELKVSLFDFDFDAKRADPKRSPGRSYTLG
jgi:hypothetical protein